MPSDTISTVGWTEWEVPNNVSTVQIDLRGAGSLGREGGRVLGLRDVNPGDKLWVRIGEAGQPAVGGDGGATAEGGGGHGGNGYGSRRGGDGGGGATFIRLGSQWGPLIAVAGGAGGRAGSGALGGQGGANTGGAGLEQYPSDLVDVPTGGTQSHSGQPGINRLQAAFNGDRGANTEVGLGGRGGQQSGFHIPTYGGGGGGGGYFPGSGGTASTLNAPATGGSGGSNLIEPLYNAHTYRGEGGTVNGLAILTFSANPIINLPPTPPSEVTINGQPEADDLATGSNTGPVTIEATLSDPNNRDTVRMLVRVSTTKEFFNWGDVYSEWVTAGNRVGLNLEGLAPNTHYYAQLFTQDDSGRFSSSDTGGPLFNSINFWTNRPPDAPELVSPQENATLPSDLVTFPITFDWTYSDPDGQDSLGYELRYRLAATPVASEGPWLYETTFVNPGVTSHTTSTLYVVGNVFYDWSIRTRDTEGVWGEWSLNRSWFSLGATTPPRLDDPVYDTAISVEEPNTFRWTFVDPTPVDTQVNANLRFRLVGQSEANWITLFGDPAAVPGSDPFWKLTAGEIEVPLVTRTNLVKNPAFEVDLTDWQARLNTTVARVTGGATPGTYALEATVLSSAAFSEVQQIGSGTSGMPVTGGAVYTFQAKVNPSVTRNMAIVLRFYDSAGTFLSAPGGVLSCTAGIWTVLWQTVTAPANAAYASLYISYQSALIGETFKVDQVMVEKATALNTYFDGDTPDDGTNFYRWTGVPGNATSISTLGGGQGTLVGFDAGYHYEWQVQTLDNHDDWSEWSESQTFWTSPLSVLPPRPAAGVAKGSLGCGETRVFVYQRGGTVVVGEVTPLAQVTYGRSRDDISKCVLTTNGFDYDCGEMLGNLHAWMHELVVFRDGKRVWEGPITRIGYTVNSVQIEAQDVMMYVYRRIMRQGYNDSYHVLNGVQFGLTSVVDRARRIIMNALAYDDPNVLPYLASFRFPNDARQSRVVPDYAKTAWEEVDDLAATAGLDYTTVGRRIILWDTHRAIGRLPELRDKDFSDPPIVTEYGMQLSNYFAVTNNNGVWGAVQRPEKFEPYGSIELLASAYGESDSGESGTLSPAAYSHLVTILENQAARGMNDRWPTPVVVRVPDNSALSVDAPVTLDQLIPGVWLPVFSEGTCRRLGQWQKLDSVLVEVTPNQESVRVTMSPAPNDGQDPDAEATADEGDG